MTITPDMKNKIETLATIIDYGMYGVDLLACIKHYPEECDGNDRFHEQSTIDSQITTLGWQAYFIIYKDILNYTEQQLEILSEGHAVMMQEMIDELKLGNDDVVYSKELLIQYIVKYIEDMIWDEKYGVWHPNWE